MEAELDQTPRLAPPVRPRLRGILHALAAAASIAGMVWLVTSASSTGAVAAAWTYGIAGILCYLTSAAYHLVARSPRARGALRRADHAMIYVLIAGTATPVCLLAVTGWWRWVVLVTFWLGAACGIGLTLMPNSALPRFRMALYVALGWVGVLTLPALTARPWRAAVVLAAGCLYTIGAILFRAQRPRLHPRWFGYHEFWHGIGIAAGALLFVVNLGLISSS